MADSDGRYFCDCPRFCKEKKPVSRSTYYDHAKHRKILNIDLATFRTSHAQNPVNQPVALAGVLGPNLQPQGLQHSMQNQVSKQFPTLLS